MDKEEYSAEFLEPFVKLGEYFRALGKREGLEEAAKACEELEDNMGYGMAQKCADAIRSLMVPK